MIKEADLGKDMERVVTRLREEFGDEFDKVSGDVWNIFNDKTEAYDKIKMLPKSRGAVAF